MNKTSKVITVLLGVAMLAALFFSIISVVGLKSEVTNLKQEVTDLGPENIYFSDLPDHNNCLFMSTKEPIEGRGVWLIVGPNGIPGGEGSYSNLAGFEVWRQDPSLPESYKNLEWLEITAGSPCYKTDDFLISTNAWGTGKCRNLIFGANLQEAFTIMVADDGSIYTIFENDLLTANTSKLGLFGNESVSQQAHIEDANRDNVSTKFNELLHALEAYGLLKGGNNDNQLGW